MLDVEVTSSFRWTLHLNFPGVVGRHGPIFLSPSNCDKLLEDPKVFRQ